MGIGVEDTPGAPRTEAERRRAEEPPGRMESAGPSAGGAEDGTGYGRLSVRRSVRGARTDRLTRTLGTPHRDPVRPGPNPSVLVRRFLFHSHFRRPGQSVAQFAAELKHLSDQCGFGSALDDALRDRLVCGLEEEALQRRLLEEDGPLSFDRALDISLEMEIRSRSRADPNPDRSRSRADPDPEQIQIQSRSRSRADPDPEQIQLLFLTCQRKLMNQG
uniref:Uncharacterized protein n=1 Tax=Sphaeramia orbicularis TaxID=375764 RepID=A0A673AII8_9TELE